MGVAAIFNPTPLLPSPSSVNQRRHCRRYSDTGTTSTASSLPQEPPPLHAQPLSLPLHSKNPHIVSRDIARLARANKLDEALTVLDYAEQRGVPVAATAFSAVFSACERRRALHHLRHAHAHLRLHGLSSNEFLYAKLARAYAACSAVDLARAAVTAAATSTAYPWNALLKGTVISGCQSDLEHSIISLFQEMRELGVAPNEYTFSCLVKRHAGSADIIQGSKAHALLIKNGLADSSSMLKTGLVDMYFKCGKVRMALKVFEEMPEKDVVAWGTVISGFAHKKLRNEAIEYLRRMASEGIEMNSVVITAVLPAAGELLSWKLGKEIHAYALKKYGNFSRLASVQSGLIDMYCKCGDMVSGRRVFYGSKDRNVVLWTALMSGYSSNGRLDQALRSLIWMQQEGIKPDVVTIATVLPVCVQLKALKCGKEIHAYALKRWFLPNVSISTSLMTLYSVCGRLEYSCKVFDGMTRKNVIAWTALIESYLKNSRPYDALNVFRSMHLGSYWPDGVTIGRVLSTAGELRLLKLGKEVHGHLLKKRMTSIPFVTAELINMYGKCGYPEKARIVFDGVHTKGSLTWTAIIEAYGLSARYEDALDLFDVMISNGFCPNHFTFDAVLNICDRGDWPAVALHVFDMMVRVYNLKASEDHYNSIIRLLYRAGREDEAQRFVYLRSAVIPT